MVRMNLYLLKENVTNVFPFDLINNEIVPNRNCIFDKNVCLASDDSTIYSHLISLKRNPKVINRADSDFEIYYRNKDAYSPEWQLFWGINDEITQQTADAIIILNISTRKFVICHGYCSHLLNPYSIESYFGLRTAVNMIDPNCINCTDVFTPSEQAFLTRKKTGIGAEFNDFEINTLNTLLKNIAGRVKEEYQELLMHVDAADSFKFNFSSDTGELVNLLEHILEIYDLDTYKSTSFKYLDNFRPIKDKEEIDSYNEELIKAIKRRDDTIKIVLPADLNYSGAVNFKFTGLGKRSEIIFNGFDISNTFYKILNRSKKEFQQLEDLQSPKIQIIDFTSEKIVSSYSLHKCLYYEILDEDKWIFLENGVWYEVDKDFSDSIDSDISHYIEDYLTYEITYNKCDLLSRHGEHNQEKKRYENWFNQDFTKHLESQNKAICLDADNIQLSGYDKIELCDVLFRKDENTKYLFHVKYNYGSSALSHLFSQGYVSAQLLTNEKFRRLVNNKISDPELKFEEDESYDSRNHTIIYTIISKKNSSEVYSIPLFSKINLKIFLDRLKSMQYRVKLCFIEEV